MPGTKPPSRIEPYHMVNCRDGQIKKRITFLNKLVAAKTPYAQTPEYIRENSKAEADVLRAELRRRKERA